MKSLSLLFFLTTSVLGAIFSTDVEPYNVTLVEDNENGAWRLTDENIPKNVLDHLAVPSVKQSSRINKRWNVECDKNNNLAIYEECYVLSEVLRNLRNSLPKTYRQVVYHSRHVAWSGDVEGQYSMLWPGMYDINSQCAAYHGTVYMVSGAAKNYLPGGRNLCVSNRSYQYC